MKRKLPIRPISQLLLCLSTLTVLLSIILPATTLGHEAAGIDLFPRVIEKSKPAVVFIRVEKTKNKETPYKDDPELSKFFGDDSIKDSPFFNDNTSYNFGSGFIFSSNGYILTNSHVIKDASEITVTLGDKRTFPGTLIGTDKKTDIGVIKIDARNLPTIPLGNSDHIKAGQWVLAIGSPYQHIQSVTAGIISATGRNTLGVSDYENFIQTDAAINPGNSGGPLLNTSGQAIGINTAFQTQTGGYMGIGFAVPINIARYVSEQLIAGGKVTRAWLGVAMLDASSNQLTHQGLSTTTTAAYIKEVKPDSPAEKAGLQKEDLIFAINNIKIAGAADVRNRIALTPPSSEVIINIYRNRIPQEIKAKLAILNE